MHFRLMRKLVFAILVNYSNKPQIGHVLYSFSYIPGGGPVDIQKAKQCARRVDGLHAGSTRSSSAFSDETCVTKVPGEHRDGRLLDAKACRKRRSQLPYRGHANHPNVAPLGHHTYGSQSTPLHF